MAITDLIRWKKGEAELSGPQKSDRKMGKR